MMTEHVCKRCGGTGKVDSGGFDAQGHSINIPCECQTEHVHEWEFDGQDLELECANYPCKETMTLDQLLNEYETLKKAMERLSAEDAKMLGDKLQSMLNGIGKRC
jgi:hypothetical protein